MGEGDKTWIVKDLADGKFYGVYTVVTYLDALKAAWAEMNRELEDGDIFEVFDCVGMSYEYEAPVIGNLVEEPVLAEPIIEVSKPTVADEE